MKKIFSISAFAAICTALLALASCSREEVDTDQLDGPVAFAAMAPNPVVRGSELRIIGKNLQDVAEVHIPGIDPITEIEHIEREGRVSEIRIVVPKEGPEVGKVTIVTSKGKKASSTADLTYTEGLEFDGFTAAAKVMPGDVITLKGDYINTVREVIFTSGDGTVTVTGDAIFDVERHSAKVTVPAQATTGIIRVGDIDEAADPTAIPTIIPSEKELTVGSPTVVKSEKATVKAGQVIEIEGTYLNMIKSVTFAEAVEGKIAGVSADNKTISVVVPGEAEDGEFSVTSYAGETFVAGELEAVIPDGLKIKAEDRYKAGHNVIITGSDLDLITSVTMGGVNATFSYMTADEEYEMDRLVAVIPEDAPDGEVVASLANGTQISAGSVEFVNPEGKPSTETITARESFEINGTDLELITEVTVGGIACEFALDLVEMLPGIDEEGDAIEIPVYDSTKVIVNTLPTILSGAVEVSKANGWKGVIGTMEVSYSEAVALELPASVALGKKMTVTGTNLFAIEAIRIKGKKVTSYASKSDTELVFDLPDGMSPGVYRLDLTLTDGSELTWAIPFEVTASYTEIFIWEGSMEISGWNGQQPGSEDGFLNAGIKEGDVVRIYLTPLNDEWQLQLHGGHWDGLFLDELDGGQIAKADNSNIEKGYFAFNVTAQVLDQLTSIQNWGGAMTLSGDNYILTGISLIQFGASEKPIWEGSEYSGADYDFNLELGSETAWIDAGLEVGQTVRVYFTADDAETWEVQLFDGHWKGLEFAGHTPANQFNATNSPSAIKDGFVSFEVTAEHHAQLTGIQNWGSAMILQGKGVTFTRITVM